MKIVRKHIEEYLKHGRVGSDDENKAIVYGIMITENSTTKMFNTEEEFFNNIVLEANKYLKAERLYTNYISKKYI